MSSEQWDIFWPSFIGSLLVAVVSIVTIWISNAHQARLKKIEQGRNDLESFSKAVSSTGTFIDEANEFLDVVGRFASAKDDEKEGLVEDMGAIFDSLRAAVENAETELTRMGFVSPHRVIRNKCGDLQDDMEQVIENLRTALRGPINEDDMKSARIALATCDKNTRALKNKVLSKYW